MPTLKRLIHEIHRRSLWQVVGIYLVGAWIGYQVILGLTDGLGLPAWVPPFAFVLFIIGLPIVVATAFVQEGAPAREDFRRARAAEVGASTETGSAPGDEDAPAVEPGPGLQHLLTWPRAVLGGVLAFALLGAGTATWIGMRAFGIGPVGSLVAAGALDASEPILVADFQSSSRDSVIAAVVSEAFRVDFARSTLVRAVEPEAVRNGLRRMGRGEETRLATELAKELALRDGIKAYLVGDVSGVGGGYVISARLIATGSGETLLAYRETARDSADLIPAIDRLSRSIRERTGESLRTIRKEPPLAQVATSSLEALRWFTEARRVFHWENDQAAAFELYARAVELDSTFASAWRTMAAIHANHDRYDQAMDAIARALRFQDRLTETERNIAMAQEAESRRDFRRAIELYERAHARNPHDGTTLNNLAWAYFLLDDVPRSERYFRMALEVSSDDIIPRRSLAGLLWRAGRFDEARAEYEAALETEPDAVGVRLDLATLPTAQGDFESADRNFRDLMDSPTSPARVRELARQRLARNLVAQGRLAEASHIADQWVEATPELDQREIRRLLAWFAVEHEILGDASAARATLSRLMDLVDRLPEPESGLLAAVAGICLALENAACGQHYLDQAGITLPLATWSPRWQFRLHGELARVRGDHDEAIRLYRASADTCRNCFEMDVARAFLAAGQPDSAAAAYERVLATPSTQRLWRVDWRLVPIHELLAEHYEEQGDVEAAARHYRRVAELWDQADPVLRPRVDRAHRALARLMREVPR